ncbi:C58 family peptidase [Bradyrhizobium sp. IC3069]|uniref:YopT-type cysteine protease domain-containing protein n=1 Tax=Bradyrhizobium TaxID=374 RepID=UPI001CD28B43|nr:MULTISPECIES: YopT-type cysteine protease domain-containing protein [Bradyrhizobium]MCA1360888.1 C58 family peptidase [Bradyrhizobium sp. IC4059]MCA1518311.1 C58 family peptidase [Bradyrhizobium sp. IC3069]MCA1529661.1 C58 family peptidase [Bradyrhizobium yuanmingense]
MYNRLDGQYTRADQADGSIKPEDSSEFAQTLTEVARRESLPSGELIDRMGLCFSKPHTSESIVYSPSNSRHSSSLSSSSELSSTDSPVRALFDYRTAELPEANVNGICVGLVAEWLLNLPSSPSSRMRALLPDTEKHRSAASRQEQYEELKAQLKNDGAEGSHNLQAKSTTLRDAGLEPSAEETRYRFDTSSCIDQIVKELTEDASMYLVSLRFAAGGAHMIATVTSNGTTTLFDPNYGEFSVPSDEVGELFKSLAERYRSPPNKMYISTVVTQRVT